MDKIIGQDTLSKKCVIFLYSILTNWKQICNCLYILKCFLPTYPCKSQELYWTHGKFQVEPFLSYPWVKRKGKLSPQLWVEVWVHHTRRKKLFYSLFPFLWVTPQWLNILCPSFNCLFVCLLPERRETPLPWWWVWA